MQSLETILKKKLKDAGKVAVLGIGSELRGDDAAGLIVAEELQKSKISKLKVFFGGTAPENLTGEIIKYKPTHIIIIDSADLDKDPGSVLLISSDDVGGISFSSHMMPIKMMADYLLRSIKCEIMVIGIQPETLEFGSSVSKEVEKSVKKISGIIRKCLDF